LSLTLREAPQFLLSSLLLLVLISSIGQSVNSQVLPSTPTLQHNSLAFTVQPDRSVKIGWNTTATLPPSTIPMNISNMFPPGYAIHSTSSFSQQTSAVVQTTKTQYQLPAQAVTPQSPLSSISSLNFTAVTQTGPSGHGSLTITTYPNVPVNNVMVSYVYSATQVHLDASVQLYFSPTYGGFLSNQTAFQDEFARTFLNSTWTDLVKSQIQNATRNIISITNFSGAATYPYSSTAIVSITLDAVPSASATDFVAAFEQTLTSMSIVVPAGLDSIIRSALALAVSESLSFTYAGSTRAVVLQFTTTYVADLDSKLNSLKNQIFQLLFAFIPAPVPAPVSFINSTSVIVSQMSTTSDLDLNASIAKTTLQDLIIKPPTVGPNTNFTIPGLFQTLGMFNQTGTDLTLIGGSNSSYTVKILVPAGTPAPNSTTANSYTWTNQNATALQGVRFELVATSSSLLALLTSPTALALEGIAAVAIIAGVIILMRRRRAAVPAPTSVMGPAPTPGPSPAPPSPAPPNP
jgi:hypothetical protein